MSDQVTPIVFYGIQHKWTHRSEWLKPDGPLIEEAPSNWSFSSFDHFGKAFDPHTGTGNNWKSVDKRAADEMYKLWCDTGRQGWYKLKHALKALKRVRKMDAAGDYDCRGPYNEHTQAARHIFRVVKCRYFTDHTPIDMNDPAIIEELV